MTPEDRVEERRQLLDQAINRLLEHASSVHIVAVFDNDNDTMTMMDHGHGSYYERLGALTDVVNTMITSPSMDTDDKC